MRIKNSLTASRRAIRTARRATARATVPSGVNWHGIDHVQLAIPAGGEPAAREFYCGQLGLSEVPKPPALAERGGCWFASGATVVHVGVDPEFVPARKAHPALLVSELRRLIDSTGLAARWSSEIPGVLRCHIDDPFGNRIELIEAS